MPQSFQALNCLRGKEHIATNVTHFGRNMLDYDDTVALAYSSHYFALLVLAGTICDATSHLEFFAHPSASLVVFYPGHPNYIIVKDVRRNKRTSGQFPLALIDVAAALVGDDGGSDKTRPRT